MKDELKALLTEFKEIFALSYQHMPRLDTKIVVHRISIKSQCPPSVASFAEDEIRDYPENQRSRKATES